MGTILFISIFILFALLWAISGTLLIFSLQKIATVKKEIRALYQERRDEIPLLIMSINNFVVKGDDVFKKIITVRRELTFHPDVEQEHALTNQLLFLDTIAKKHSNLLLLRKYRESRDSITKIEQNITTGIDEYNHLVASFHHIRKRSLWVLFPGGLLYNTFSDIHL